MGKRKPLSDDGPSANGQAVETLAATLPAAAEDPTTSPINEGVPERPIDPLPVVPPEVRRLLADLRRGFRGYPPHVLENNRPVFVHVETTPTAVDWLAERVLAGAASPE